MGGLGLLNQARAAGLDVRTVGNRLRLCGPQRLESIALELLRCKAEIVPILETARSIREPGELPADWRVEWEERTAIREYEGGQAREHAEAEAFTEIPARMRTAGEST